MVMDSWETFMKTGQLDPGVRSVIGESWLRCRRGGLDPCDGGSEVAATGPELETVLAANRDLIESARPFMDILCASLGEQDFVVVLTDRNGYMLESFGSEEILQSAFRMHYARGARLTEELNGTTAIGLALLGHGPIQVIGTEHYCRQYHEWGCSAAPLTGEDGSIVGILSITVRKEMVHPHTLGMVVSAATAIGNMLLVKEAQKELGEKSRLHETILNSLFDGLMMLNRDGYVTFINPSAARMIFVDPKEALGKHMTALVPFKPVAMQVLYTGQGYTDKEIVVDTPRGPQRFIQTAILIRDQEGKIEGVVDIFRELKQVHRMINRMVGATARFTFEDIIGESPSIRECIRLARIAANSNANTLIQGESGTGKELFAQAIHNAGSRAHGPFVAINCGALPRDLVESELFGYEEGSFTGAKHGGRPGKFEMAQGGTIFLDEIGEMPLEMQVKLLRVLQDHRIMRIGGQRFIEVDVRVIAAANGDLTEDVGQGNFRSDLYYRLNVLLIPIPPLRDRQEDILLLAGFFLQKLCSQSGTPPKAFSPEAQALLARYPWPGNIRELENVVERAVNLCTEDLIGPEHLPAQLHRAQKADRAAAQSLREMEKGLVQTTLDDCKGNISQAARTLGIGRTTLYQKIKQYGLRI
jgi:sigma-54 dependent transcriptional regulator, acetoin dehydrogenase operon transcriptional activator AcoR